MIRVSVDDSELRTLIVDLRGAGVRVNWNAAQTMKRAARLVDGAMKRDARGHNYLSKNRSFLKHVSHDVEGLDAEIGFNKAGQGNLANIIVFGSVNNAPVYDLMSGPRKVLPEIERAFADSAEDSILGGSG